MIASVKPTSKKALEALFLEVFVATPVGHYFLSFLDQSHEKTLEGSDGISDMLSDTSYMELENSVMKAYLEDFYYFCEQLGGDTANVMCHLLKRRADKRAINICINSFDSDLGKDIVKRKADRQRMMPAIGYLFPEGYMQFPSVKDAPSLKNVLSPTGNPSPNPYPEYRDLWEAWVGDESGDLGNLDDGFYKMEVEDFENAFLSQSHYGCIYAFVKLKEQEIRNLEWICECVDQDEKGEIEKYIRIFQDEKNRETRAYAGRTNF